MENSLQKVVRGSLVDVAQKGDKEDMKEEADPQWDWKQI